MNTMSISIRHLSNETRGRLLSSLSSLPAYQSTVTKDELFTTMRTEFVVEGREKHTFALVHKAGGAMVFGTFIITDTELKVSVEHMQLTHLKLGDVEPFEMGLVSALINFSKEYEVKERTQHVG